MVVGILLVGSEKKIDYEMKKKTVHHSGLCNKTEKKMATSTDRTQA